MFGFHTKPVDTGASSFRRVRSRATLGLETLEARDIPGSFTASALAVSSVRHYPPSPIMPQVSQASLSAVHHYPPQPIMPQVSQASLSAVHHYPPHPV
jgi:hypothetical protein